MNKKLTLELSLEELDFLDWAMSFLEGGPFGADHERQRDEMAFKIRRALAEYDEDQSSSVPVNANISLPWHLIHPAIKRVSRSRFQSGHYADSVEAAYKEINKVVKGIVKSATGEELDGASLMHKAFSPNQPVIRLGDLSTETGRNIQQGYMQLFAGSMIGIRNPRAHENSKMDSRAAIHLLMLASLLISMLKKPAIKVP